MLPQPRVMLIEDHPVVAEWLIPLIEAALNPRSLTHHACFTDAKAAICAEAFDIFLVDLGLPDGDGTDLISLIKQTQPNASCIVTTIFDDSEHLFPALHAGADGYLLKDDSREDFTASIVGILAGKPPLSASIAQMMLQQFRPQTSPEDQPLTARETDMLCAIAKGLSVKEAAEMLSISPHTASGYIKTMYQKLHINSRAEATAKAIRMGVIRHS